MSGHKQLKKLNQRQINNAHLSKSFLTHIARVFGFVGENPWEAECIWGITPIFWEMLKSCKFLSQASKRSTETTVSFLFKTSQSKTVRHVRLNLFNHVLALFHTKFACNSAIWYPVFRWESCKDCMWESVKNSRVCVQSKSFLRLELASDSQLMTRQSATRVKHAGS